MKIRGVLIDVDSEHGKAKEIDIEEGNLDEFYSVLNCNTIDIVTRKIGDRVFDIVCDDEGALRENPNVSAIAEDGTIMLVGNLFVCNHYKSNLTSLSKEDVDYVLEHVLIGSFIKRHSKTFRVQHILTDVGYV